MTQKSNLQRAVNKIASKRVLAQSAPALRAYDIYKKAADIIKRAELASGKRVIFRHTTGSTLNFKINRYGVCSTKARFKPRP